MPNVYTNFISLALFAYSFLIIWKYRTSKVNRLFFCLAAFFYIVLYVVYKLADYFTGNGIDQATIIQLKFGLGGAAFGEYVRLISLTFGILFASTLILGTFVFFGRQKKNHISLIKCLFAYILLFIALLANPANINLYNLPKGTLISSRASSKSGGIEFYKYYKKPRLQSLSEENKNIVFIYAESLERAFFNEDVFPGLVTRLKEIEKHSISFSNINMAHGTGGTMWAISASQCGLPLFLPSRAILKQRTGDFLPSATCLGDLLEDEGYYLTYYGGASLKFTRKGDFFRSHGFAEVLGKKELIPKLKNKKYLNFWGLYDDSLFDLTYKRFIELSETKKKFGLFLLTLDTHPPGYVSKTCENIPYKNGENIHLNAVACSDYLISNFIHKIANSPYASQTVIFLVSDHFVWDNTPTADLLKKARHGGGLVFMIIEPENSENTEVTTRGTVIDIAKTILPFIGYSGQIGLGRDLLQQNIKIEKERSYILNNLLSWKPEVLKFWGQPQIKKFLSVDIRKKLISIDNKAYKAPIFIELTDDLNTALLYRFHKTIEQHLEKIDPVKKFLWVDDCKDIKLSGKFISDTGVRMAKKGWCLITGHGKEYIYKTKLKSNVRYTVSELHGILGNTDNKPGLAAKRVQ